MINLERNDNKNKKKNALSSTYTTAASTRETFLIAFEQLQLLSNKATLTDFDFDRNFKVRYVKFNRTMQSLGMYFQKRVMRIRDM